MWRDIHLLACCLSFHISSNDYYANFLCTSMLPLIYLPSSSACTTRLCLKKKWCKQHFALRKNMHMIQERNSKWKQYVANNSKTILCQSMKQWLIFFYLVFVVIHVCIVYLLFSTEDYLKLPFYQSKIPSEIRGYASIFSIFCVKKRQNS